MEEKLLTLDEVSEIIGFKPRTIENWRYERGNKLKYVHVGRSVRYRHSDVLEFMKNLQPKIEGE